VGPNDAIAFVVLMATIGAVFTAFSPLGRALADRIRGRPRDAVLDSREVEALRDELQGVRHELEELAERQDFTERMLAQARERGLLQAPKER
jgi:hypothetical protein